MARYADRLLADGERVALRSRQHLLATVIEGAAVSADGALVGAVRDPRNVVDAAAVRMPHSA